MVGISYKGKCSLVGIQTFSETIKDSYVYVDNIGLVWNLQNYANQDLL